MVRIQGVDPILVDRIREISRKTVLETEQIKRIEARDSEQKERRERRQNKSSLEECIDKLNQLFKKAGASIRFARATKDGQAMVDVIDIHKKVVIAQVLPDRAFELLRTIHDPKGIILNNTI
ncbi:MAG: flagellar protein FlaG [Bacillota bacterium]